MIIVFSKEWFKKYNKPITWLARLPILGEFVFRFKKFGHYIDRKKIVEITPNSAIEFIKLKGKKVELKQHFFSRNEYALRLQQVFYPIWITFHIWDIITRPIPQLNLGFDTLTQYPGSIGTNNPVAGHLRLGGGNDTFSTIRDTATGIAGIYNDVGVRISAGDSANRYNSMRRGIALFDTSSLTSSATISAAVLSWYVNSKSDTMSQAIGITSSNPTSTSELAGSDYDVSLYGSTRFATDISIASISTSAYNDFTFNASGISSISKTGISKYAIRISCDIDNSAPTWSSLADASVNVNFITSNKPKLVVTYTLPSTGFVGGLALMGCGK